MIKKADDGVVRGKIARLFGPLPLIINDPRTASLIGPGNEGVAFCVVPDADRRRRLNYVVLGPDLAWLTDTFRDGTDVIIEPWRGGPIPKGATIALFSLSQGKKCLRPLSHEVLVRRLTPAETISKRRREKDRRYGR